MDRIDRTDNELMTAAAEGDLRSFDEIVDRYTDRIYAFARRLCGDNETAEDATQETFIKVWKNRKKFDSEGSFRAWIFAIARNATLDIMRKRRDQTFSALSSPEQEVAFGEEILDEETVDIPEAFDQKLLEAALEETLETLRPDHKAVVILHDREGMTFDEIGKALRKPLNTVKSHYRRAIAALRERLDSAPNGSVTAYSKQHRHEND